MAQQPNVIVYDKDYEETYRHLTGEELKRIIESGLDYAKNGVAPKANPDSDRAYNMALARFVDTQTRHLENAKTWSENGKKATCAKVQKEAQRQGLTEEECKTLESITREGGEKAGRQYIQSVVDSRVSNNVNGKVNNNVNPPTSSIYNPPSSISVPHSSVYNPPSSPSKRVHAQNYSQREYSEDIMTELGDEALREAREQS